jgi:hypothetical protein
MKHGREVFGIFHDDSIMAGSLEVHAESIELKGDNQSVDLAFWIVELTNHVSSLINIV